MWLQAEASNRVKCGEEVLGKLQDSPKGRRGRRVLVG